ncbi:MAG: hypothetical protein WBQ22_06460 [Bradyrhizobium sp.]|jgi:hypothetical protein
MVPDGISIACGNDAAREGHVTARHAKAAMIDNKRIILPDQDGTTSETSGPF